MKKAVFLNLFIIFFSTGSFAQEFEHFLNDSALVNASLSLCVTEITTGKPVIDYNSRKSLMPASIQKLVTSAAALELLGPDHRFTTSIGYTGNIKNGRLDGDIVIRGGGDPAFGSEAFPDYYAGFPEHWVEEIRKLGIKKIKGRVITDDTYFDYQPVPDKWLWEDIGNYYGAGAYGASVFENTYQIHLKTDTGINGMIITAVVPEECRSELANWLKAEGKDDNGYIFAAPYSTQGWLAGTVPAGMQDFVLDASITDPPLLIARIMTSKLKAAGIKITGTPSTVRTTKDALLEKMTVISSIISPPLHELIGRLNHKSINLYAEHLTKELGKRFKNSGSTREGVNVIYEFLDSAGLETEGIFIEDGSGLSPLNSINSAELVKLLVYLRTNGKYFDYLIESLPDPGEPGTTLRNCFKDEIFSSCLKAKSGSMTRVKSYAGYLRSMAGNEMAFSLIINNFKGSPTYIVSLFEDVIKDLILNK